MIDFNNSNILYGNKCNDGMAHSYRNETTDLEGSVCKERQFLFAGNEK